MARSNESDPAHVDSANSDRLPLLLIAGTKDHVVQLQKVQNEFDAYVAAKSPAMMGFKILRRSS